MLVVIGGSMGCGTRAIEKFPITGKYYFYFIFAVRGFFTLLETTKMA